MTELGITQEYLLLAVNDRGRFSPLNPQQPICFVAAALGELAGAGAVAFTGEKVGLAGPLPEGLRCLKPLYDFIDRPRPVPLARVFYLPAAGQAAQRLERLHFRLCSEGSPTPGQAALAVLLCQSGVVAQKLSEAAAAKAESALAALLLTGSEAARAAHAAQDMADRVNAILCGGR